MSTIPISDVVPLAQWIQAYHSFRTRLDLLLYQTRLSLTALHHDRLGPPAQAGVWEASEYRVLVEERSWTFEVPEDATLDSALAAFTLYQEKLFKG
jgi:hypothetical protein